MCLGYFIVSPGSTSAVERTQIDERGNESMRRSSRLLGQRTKKLESILRGESRALDNFRDLGCAVAIGTGHFLHHGWVHPHPVGPGRRCSYNSAHSRPKSYLIEVI